MSTIPHGVVVSEILRPENSIEPVIYHVNERAVYVVNRLHATGHEICCDIYPDGKCRVYIYNSVDEIAVSTSPKVSHSVAHDALRALLDKFDLFSLL